MWPWEHLALGYLFYGVAIRFRSLLGGRRSRVGPTDRAAVALAVGTQFPDLVDKPLAWVVGVLPSGVTLAHSLFVALPATALAVLAERRWRLDGAGAAFALGYVSHLSGDLLYPLALGDDVSITYLMWPLVAKPPRSGPLLADVQRYWATFVEFLGTPRGQLYLLAELAFLAVAAGLWLWDGTPGIHWRRTPERR